MEEGIAQDLLEHPPHVLPALGLPCLQGGCRGGHPQARLQSELVLWGSCSFAEMVFVTQPLFCTFFSLTKGDIRATHSSQNLWAVSIHWIVGVKKSSLKVSTNQLLWSVVE